MRIIKVILKVLAAIIIGIVSISLGAYFAHNMKERKPKKTESVSKYRPAEKQDDPQAQYRMGRTKYNRENYEQAVYWFRKAAEQGHADAQNDLGICYENGYYVIKDYKQAVYWYRKAAEQGNANAQSNLGICYNSGRGVNRDSEQALFWFRKAAEQGNEYAQYVLDDKQGLE